MIVNLHGAITDVNRQLADWAGYEPEELIGHSIEELVPEDLGVQHRSHRASYLAHGLPTRALGSTLNTRLPTRQQAARPVHPPPTPGEPGAGGHGPPAGIRWDSE